MIFDLFKGEKQKKAGTRRPGSGPYLVAFSRAELEALVTYATPYALEEATKEEEAAWHRMMEKAKNKLNRREG